MNHTTESVNPASRNIDRCDTPEILRIINQEDAGVARVVAAALPAIAPVVEQVCSRLAVGGRLLYVGAGTSGRIAVMDAAECPPTYGVPPETVQAIVAGGPGAILRPTENAEDDEAAGTAAMAEHRVTGDDIVIGLSASGNTPFVRAALLEARRRGAATAAVICNRTGRVADAAELTVALPTGPEVICGSTRMKAGTAQKMLLNMISTAAMIRLGRVTGNFMTAMAPTNRKLRERAIFIIGNVCDLSAAEAEHLLDLHHGNIRAAINHHRESRHA